MRKKIVAASILIVLALASCKCSAERAAVSRLEGQQEKLFAKYSAYVNADPKLDAAAKDDERKLLQSLRDITSALKRSLGE
jgi:ABC-type phosphate/phosphonate transport system substrate-binding protein